VFFGRDECPLLHHILVVLSLLLTSKRGFSASYCLGVSFLGSSAAKKVQSWPTGFGFLFFCGGAQGIFWALVVAAGGVLATLFIPQIRGRLLTALTWAYLQESHYLVYGIYQWGRSLKIVGTVGVVPYMSWCFFSYVRITFKRWAAALRLIRWELVITSGYQHVMLATRRVMMKRLTVSLLLCVCLTLLLIPTVSFGATKAANVEPNATRDYSFKYLFQFWHNLFPS